MILEQEEVSNFSTFEINYSQFVEKDDYSNQFEDCFHSIFIHKSSDTEIDDININKSDDESFFKKNETETKIVDNVDIKKKIDNVIIKDCKEIDKPLIIKPKNKCHNFEIFTKCSNKFYEEFQNIGQKKKSIHFLVCGEINENNNELRNNNNTVHIKNTIKLNKKKEKIKKKRKYKPDDIRKKIKSRFHKIFKNIINIKLKKANSQEFFDFLPQSFVSNISKEKNKEVMNMTYRQILEKDFSKDFFDKKNSRKKVKKDKFKRNIKVLRYLDSHKDISEKSGFNIISEMTYSNILKEYFLSKEFELSVEKLKSENESIDYINEYLIKAKTYISFFMENNNKQLNNNDNSLISFNN